MAGPDPAPCAAASARRVDAPKRFGRLAALLALVVQVLLGGAALPGQAAADQVGALGVICHADAPAPPGRPPPHRRHMPGCALCPHCVMAMQGVIPAAAPALPAPSVRIAARAALPPPARAPPAQPRRVALPRGPPVLT